MSRARELAASIAVAAILGAAACGGDPPDKEMQQAQTAIDAARTAGADEYAREEFAAAQDALKRARDAVDQHDYRLALNYALDSRERADAAAKEAVDRKAAARAEAERALTGASAALSDARSKLKAAENARAPQRILADARRKIADGEQAVQKARAAFGQGDYLAVAGIATPAAARLITVARDLDAVTAIVGRRRR